MIGNKVLVKLKPHMGKYFVLSTPSTSIILTDEAKEVDVEVYERLKTVVDLVPLKEKKREKKTDFLKDEEI